MATSPYIPALSTPEGSPGRGAAVPGMPPRGWHPSDVAGAAAAATRPPIGGHRHTGSYGMRTTPETTPRYPPGAFPYAPAPQPYGPAPYPPQHGYGYPQPPPPPGAYAPGPPGGYPGPYAPPPPPPAGHYRPGPDPYRTDPRFDPYADMPPLVGGPMAPGYGMPGHPAAPYGAPYGGGYDPYGYEPEPPVLPRPLQPENDESLDMRRLRWQADFQKYTRVLTKDTVQLHKIKLQLHPYLRARGEGGSISPMTAEVGAGDEGFIRWDMRLRISSASFSTGPATRIWTRGRTAPATFPPTTDLTIVSRSFPWSIPIHDSKGITVGGLMDALDNAMHQHVGKNELNAGGPEVAKRVGASYHANRAELRGVLMDGLLRVDFLGERCEFGGFMPDEQLVQERMNVPGYTTAIALVCDLRGAPAPAPAAAAHNTT